MTTSKLDSLKSSFSNKKKRTAALTYLVFCLPRFSEWKEDAEMHYHMRQAIGLLVFALSLQGILSILVYWGAPHQAGAWTVRLILLYLVGIGMGHALRDELAPLPWIGKYSERIF